MSVFTQLKKEIKKSSSLFFTWVGYFNCRLLKPLFLLSLHLSFIHNFMYIPMGARAVTKNSQNRHSLCFSLGILIMYNCLCKFRWRDATPFSTFGKMYSYRRQSQSLFGDPIHDYPGQESIIVKYQPSSLSDLFVCLFGFLTSSSTTRLYRGRAPRQSVWQFYVLPHMRQSWETMTSVSAGHIILTPTQPVGSGRPQRGSNPGPPHQESRALPTELPRPPPPPPLIW